MAVLVLLKIKFGYAQISVPKTSIPMSEVACINTRQVHFLGRCGVKTYNFTKG